jgi:hypothetical protein
MNNIKIQGFHNGQDNLVGGYQLDTIWKCVPPKWWHPLHSVITLKTTVWSEFSLSNETHQDKQYFAPGCPKYMKMHVYVHVHMYI